MRTQLFAIALALLAGSSAPANADCSRDEAIEAETTAASLSSWPDLYASYQRFHECDDGAIAEGYSESVTRTLDEKWHNLNQLADIQAKDASFLEFVLGHVDESSPPERLSRVARRARSECPPQLSDLCDRIASAAGG